MEEDYELINNEEKQQYEFHIDGYLAKIEYILNKDGNIFLIHTEVPYVLAGRNIGKQLVKKVLADIEIHHQHVVPICPFVAEYIKKNPTWKRIVAGNTIK